MKLPLNRLLKAAAKRVRPSEGSSAGQQAPAPKRQALQPPPPCEHHSADIPEVQQLHVPAEVDLTADTPPEVATREGTDGDSHTLLEAELGRGEEPTGATPFPEVSEEGLVQPAPAADGNMEGDGPRSVPPRHSLFNDGRRAERLISCVTLPEFTEELRQLGTATFYREAYAGLVRAANSLAVTRDIINQGEEIVSRARAEVKEARARAEAAEKALEASLSAQAIAARDAQSRAEVEAGRLRAALNQLAETESVLTARNLRLAELESSVREAEARDLRLAELELSVREAEARAAHAEEEAASKVRGMEVAMETRATRAVDEFLESDRFEEEVAEASVDAFLQGFQHGKEKAARTFNIPQALEMLPDSLPDEGDGDDSTAAGP